MKLQESVCGLANDRDRALVAVAFSSAARAGGFVVDGPQWDQHRPVCAFEGVGPVRVDTVAGRRRRGAWSTDRCGWRPGFRCSQ